MPALLPCPQRGLSWPDDQGGRGQTGPVRLRDLPSIRASSASPGAAQHIRHRRRRKAWPWAPREGSSPGGVGEPPGTGGLQLPGSGAWGTDDCAAQVCVTGSDELCRQPASLHVSSAHVAVPPAPSDPGCPWVTEDTGHTCRPWRWALLQPHRCSLSTCCSSQVTHHPAPTLQLAGLPARWREKTVPGRGSSPAAQTRDAEEVRDGSRG